VPLDVRGDGQRNSRPRLLAARPGVPLDDLSDAPEAERADQQARGGTGAGTRTRARRKVRRRVRAPLRLLVVDRVVERPVVDQLQWRGGGRAGGQHRDPGRVAQPRPTSLGKPVEPAEEQVVQVATDAGQLDLRGPKPGEPAPPANVCGSSATRCRAATTSSMTPSTSSGAKAATAPSSAPSPSTDINAVPSFVWLSTSSTSCGVAVLSSVESVRTIVSTSKTAGLPSPTVARSSAVCRNRWR
jgi:hypothetical protein